MTSTKLNTVKKIIDTVGESWMYKTFGCSERSMYRYKQFDKLPAFLFDALERQTGQELPRKLFTFK